jgi:NAD(P)-dependent dehydrogenase (short-subunit alcohol dehydrogenase family)
MDLGIAGLRVLVTAGAAGIGRAIAGAFGAEGAAVHVCDVDRAALGTLGRDEPAITRSVGDVADRADVARVFDEALGRLGGLDVLVNNAGIAGPTGRVEEIHPEDWDRCLQVCLTGQFNCARLAVPHLKRSANASIVNLSSAAGKFGFSLRAPYAAAKWGVVGFTKSLAIELGPFNVRVNAIQPGVVAGPRVDRVLEARAAARGIAVEEARRQFLAPISLGRMVRTQDIANMALFLASPAGASISGQALSVCGDHGYLA